MAGDIQSVGIVVKGKVISLVWMRENVSNRKRRFNRLITKLNKGVNIDRFLISDIENMVGWMALQNQVDKKT